MDLEHYLQRTIPAIQGRRQEGCLAAEIKYASMPAVSKYRHIPFIRFLYGGDDLGSDTWESRDLNLYAFTNAEVHGSCL